MRPIAAPNWYLNAYSRYPQATGFNRGLLAFGDFTPPYSQANRGLSFATYTETTYTNMSTTARIQPMPGASDTHVYQVRGYTSGGFTATTNKQSAFTNTESVPSMLMAVERRGGSMPMAVVQKAFLIFAGGYSDSLGQYRTDLDIVLTALDLIGTSSSVLPAGRHLSCTLFNSTDMFVVGGYTSGGGTSNTNYRIQLPSFTVSTVTADSYNTQNAIGFSSNIYGYRCQGVSTGYTLNTKYSFSSGTWAAATNSPETQSQIIGGGAFVNEYEGAMWGGYQSYLKRIVYRLAWATETYTNSSYTTSDANSGFIYYHGTY